MKITYRFIDGTETIVEVADESLAKIILDMNRQFNLALVTRMTLKVMFKKKLKKESELRKPYPI